MQRKLIGLALLLLGASSCEGTGNTSTGNEADASSDTKTQFGDAPSFTPDLSRVDDAAPEPDVAINDVMPDSEQADLAMSPDVVPDVEEPPDQGQPPTPGAFDLNNVRWLYFGGNNIPDMPSWAETATLSSITFQGSNICLNHDKANVWPIGTPTSPDVEVNANPWVFIWQDGRWYGATWEWMRPGQLCKAQSSVAGDHIKVAPFDAASGWRPRSGETLYFMVSGFARADARNVEERSNPVRFVWP